MSNKTTRGQGDKGTRGQGDLLSPPFSVFSSDFFSALTPRSLRLCGECDSRDYLVRFAITTSAILIALSLFTSPAIAQQRPLITEDVEIVKPGSARFEVGFDFLQDKNYPLSGLNGDLTRLGVVSLTFGLAPNIEVETGGVIRNFLSVNRQYRPSAVPLQLSQGVNSKQDYANAGRGKAGAPVEIGRYAPGASPFGAFDMCGNVWEWTASEFKDYPGRKVASSLAGSGLKVIRGGAYNVEPKRATATYRGAIPPDRVPDKTGFRCARDAQ